MSKLLRFIFFLFPQIRQEIYTKIFKEALEDLEETRADDTKKRAEELAEKKLLELLDPVNLNLIVTVDKRTKIIYIGPEKAPESRLSNLKAEAEFLLQSDIWKIIHETPKELAQKRMFVSGESLEDMRAGRAILYTLSTQKKIVDTFSSLIKKKDIHTPGESQEDKKGV